MSDKLRKVRYKRTFISLELKINILDRLQKGEKISCVAKAVDLNEATVRTIQKNEQKIRDSVAAGCSLFARMMARPRAPIIEKTEKALSIWINDCSRKRTPLDVNVIKQTAVKIYNLLRENGDYSANPGFLASKCWFDRFKKRFSLRYRGNSQWRIKRRNTSIDDKADEECTEELQKVIEQLGNEGLNKLPKRTVSKKERVTPDFKTSSDVNIHLSGVGVDSSSPNVVKIKTEVDTDGEYSSAGTSKDVTAFAITNTDGDDFTNVRIADVRTVTSAAAHTPIVPITSLLTWPSAITAGSTALGSITKTVPLIISGTQLQRSNEIIQADDHRIIGQSHPKTSKDSPAVAIQHLPIVIKTEPVDDPEENIKLAEADAEERGQENAGDSPDPPPSKKKKMDGDDTENHGAFPLNVQNSILERLDTLNRNLETNTCAMSILSKAITDSSESNVRAINHLANAISNVGSLIYSSLQQMNLQKGQ